LAKLKIMVPLKKLEFIQGDRYGRPSALGGS